MPESTRTNRETCAQGAPKAERWKLMPEEPTDEMLSYFAPAPGWTARQMYARLYAAATEPPEEVVEQVARAMWADETSERTPAVFPGGRAARVLWDCSESSAENTGLVVTAQDREKWRKRARAALRAVPGGKDEQ